jgi:hypothetical protein
MRVMFALLYPDLNPHAHRIKPTKTNADPASDPQYWLFLQSLRVSLKKTQIQKCRHLGNVQRCKELPPIPNAERNKQQFSLTALQIREILTRIRIHGSIPLTNGSGSGCGSCYLHPGPSWRQQKIIIITLLITFWRYIHNIFKDKVIKKSKNSRIQGINVFLTIFAWW